MAVDKEHIGRDVYNAVYTLIKNNITDLQSPARNASQWIFSAWPENLGKDRDDYPIIIIDKPEFTTQNWTLKKSLVPVSIDIIIHNAGDKAAQGADNLADQIVKIITSNKYSVLRNTYRLYNAEITNMSSDVVLHERIKVHIKILTLSFDYRMSG